MYYLLGTADWHYMRKFSLTSSQAHRSFDAAFPAFKADADFIAIAKYLYGENDWQKTLGVVVAPPVEQPVTVNEEEGAPADQEEEDPQAQVALFNYINSLVHDENGGAASFQALEFLKKYIGSLEPATGQNGEENENNENSENSEGVRRSQEIVAADETEAKNIYSELSGDARRATLSILSNHVQDATHRKKAESKDIIKWLQQPNTLREYYFYKVSGLKELIKARGLTVGQGRKSADELKNILVSGREGGVEEEDAGRTATATAQATQVAPRRQRRTRRNDRGNVSEDEAKAECIEAVLKNSFLPHRKGAAREHCSLGHRLELPILKSWKKVAEGDTSPVAGLCVKGAYTAGLAAKKTAPYAKDSIDFVVTVQEQNQPLKLWGFEAKGRVTASTAAAEERELHYLNNPHVRIGEEDAFFEIASEGERFQILQHAFVYNLEAVVLAISDNQSSLIRSTIVDFSTELKTKFGNVLEKLMEVTLKWAYPPPLPPTPTGRSRRTPSLLQIPAEVFEASKNVNTINGPQTLQGTANLWHAINSLKKPFPSFVRLLPAIYAYWNVVKGGSDTMTKLMDDCLVRVPKTHLNAQSVAVTRLIQIVVVLLHRLYQVFTAKKDITFYPDLLRYRKAASNRLTYHDSLLLIDKVFKKEINKLKEQNQDTATTNSAPTLTRQPTTPQRRRNPSRQLVDGVLPQPASFAASLPTTTPKKITKMVKSGKAPPEVEAMIRDCTGRPVKEYPVKYTRCSLCGSQTAHYCLGCKRSLCFERKALKENTKPLELYVHCVRGKQKTFIKTCYHKAHEEAWARQAQK